MKKTRFFSVLTSAAALAFACTGISASAAETTISVPDDTSIVTEETNLEDMNLSDLVSMLGSASENSTAETTVSGGSGNQPEDARAGSRCKTAVDCCVCRRGDPNP